MRIIKIFCLIIFLLYGTALIAYASMTNAFQEQPNRIKTDNTMSTTVSLPLLATPTYIVTIAPHVTPKATSSLLAKSVAMADTSTSEKIEKSYFKSESKHFSFPVPVPSSIAETQKKKI